ncbi:hypothetical protein KBY83_14195 [Cyanobium sp. WKJ7-Wakatipu]|uniref:hypothetical protein n=1 Tax=Cyanobium sp. WKJ7-Wakatipu TaxID=2823726 RepID=UPI0020CD28B6|nr:hypothetical protein [Cyanobium sp. WKJ7-Wakatipu]MCP9784445.1 hypothetical protein [Cyanobium sp. WKJ7-Wakatipu]
MNYNNEGMVERWTELSKLSNMLQSVQKRLSAIEECNGEIFNRLDTIESARNISYAKWIQDSELQLDRTQHLDIPIRKIIDIYSETPQVLQYCSKSASPKAIENAIILERKPNGNYWVIELAFQEFILLPKPTILSQSQSLESLSLLYEGVGHDASEEATFCWLESPAYLYQITRHKRWALKMKGKIRSDKNPLCLGWHSQLASIQSSYEDIQTKLNQLITNTDTQGYATKADHQRTLEELYGNPINIFFSTCKPQAYALYHDSTKQGMVIVDCIVDISIPAAVSPANNMSVYVGTSPFKLMHGQGNVDFRRSTPDAKLPSQMCLIDDSQQTWVMAKSYDEASRMVSLLDGKWEPLDIE